MIKPVDNPFKEIITDEAYIFLAKEDLLNETAIRNYQIRKMFKELRAQKIGVVDSVRKVNNVYSYLAFETIRLIAYEHPKSRKKIRKKIEVKNERE